VSNDSVEHPRSRWKNPLSWVVVGLGLAIGIYSLGALAVAAPPYFYDPMPWFFEWSELIGIALLSIESFAGSLIAIHSRKRAGIFFLLSMPLTVFCIVYRSARIVTGVTGIRSPSSVSDLVLSLVFALGIFLFFGLFWLMTYRRRWPELVAAHPQTFRAKMARVVIACLVVLAAIVPVGMACVTLRMSNLGGHCGRSQPFIKPRSEHHAAFIVRVISVGLSPRAWFYTRFGQGAIREHRVGEWAIGIVQERFWGVPSSWPHLVMLTDNVYWPGETYFIDGERESTLVSHFIPVVSAQYACSRTKPIRMAALDLRILRHPPSKGATIIGYVRQAEPYHGILARPWTPSYLSGAQVEVSGPGRKTTLTTDASGIYQLGDLAAGDYTVQLLVPDGETVARVPVVGDFGKTEESIRNLHLDRDGIVQTNFDLEWPSKDKSPKQ
jgi:hypothetical protein